ncbi:hypothetical protein RFI_16557 [Reticulomyxa filosa]|uniref:Uncharacterized protein n=1 Tax=Reticulomyxa filosa TaxID=46433 RepID=X6N4H1_RETFI|nr:hypothetical protein RFI_16557 [Reticulomyxa filosa]|eukprot:ETO20659.1 hypothetical protein RFI_16557 [Reticulomyxa filosa]
MTEAKSDVLKTPTLSSDLYDPKWRALKALYEDVVSEETLKKKLNDHGGDINAVIQDISQNELKLESVDWIQRDYGYARKVEEIEKLTLAATKTVFTKKKKKTQIWLTSNRNTYPHAP